MADFTFTQINDSSGTYIDFAAPSINNAGTVAFEAFQDIGVPPGAPVGTPSVVLPTTTLTGNGNGTTTITDSSSGYNINFTPSINDAGTVVSAGSTFGGQTGILTSTSGASSNTVANNSGPYSTAFSSQFGREYATDNFVSSSAINNGGTVAYVNSQSGVTGINTVDSSGQFTTIADNSGYINNFFVGIDVDRGAGPFSVYTLPSINDNGIVAFNAGLNAGGSAIFTGSGESLTTIADTSGYIDSFASPSINNSGAVAFTAGLDAGGNGIFTGSGGELTQVADTNGLFNSFTSDTAINESGNIAFRAALDDGGIGLFTGANPLTDEVISVGDELLGSTVTNLSIARNGLNDTGTLAFTASLANGKTAVVRAEVVPEPGESIVSVLALSILFMLGWRSRRRKKSSEKSSFEF